jgi:hypothetical protein
MRMIPVLLLIVTVLAVPLRFHAAKKPFTLVISSESKSFKTGSAVEIKLSLTNNSDGDIDASANISDLTGVDPNFLFDVRDAAGNLVSKRVYKHPELATAHAMLNRLIKPGRSLEEKPDLNRLYDMSRPGEYDVQASRRASENENDGVVKSNRIRITVIP